MLLSNEILRFLEKQKINMKLSHNSSFTGERVSKQQGAGMDFKDYRPYQIGDDYRYIDWNLYSRLEQLFLKEFIEEKGSTVYFLLDRSNSMSIGNPVKLDKAVQIAAALGYIALTQLDRVGGGFFSDRLEKASNLFKGKNQLNRYFNLLEDVEPSGQTNVSNSLKQFVSRFRKPGLAVIISDLLDSDFLEGLKILKIQHWKVLVIHLLAEEDINPRVGDNNILIDSETQKRKELYIDEEILRNFQGNIEQYFKKIKRFVKHYGINYIQVRNTDHLQDIIYNVLQTRREIN